MKAVREGHVVFLKDTSTITYVSPIKIIVVNIPVNDDLAMDTYVYDNILNS